MTTDPSEIRAQIETTRTNLSNDVDALAYHANPSHIAERQVAKVKARGSRLLDRVLGSMEEVRGSASEAADHAANQLHEGVQGAGEAVANAPQAIRRQTQGSPVVAGLVAFGVGLLIAAAFPPSAKEQELAQRIKDRAEPLTERVTDAAKEVADEASTAAGEMKDEVRGA